MDQLPCGSVLAPAISCTKFKIHSVHTDTHMVKTDFFPSSNFRVDQSLLEENELGGPTSLWVSTYITYLLFKVPNPFSACRQSHRQNNFFLIQLLGRTSLCFTDQESLEENELGGSTLLWVSAHTSYLLYKVSNPFSVWRHTQGQNRFRYSYRWPANCKVSSYLGTEAQVDLLFSSIILIVYAKLK